MQSESPYDRDGKDLNKQVYIYGAFDRDQSSFDEEFGFAWSVGGWLAHAVPGMGIT